MTDSPPILLPAPRRLRMTGATARRPTWFNAGVEDVWQQALGHVAKDRASSRVVVNDCDGRLAPNAYRLLIERDEHGMARVSLHARGREGVRFAAATLRQIAIACPGDLPCLQIEDSPAFATRGFMLDVSRDKVPTMAQLRETIDLLASLKFNHLQLYTEHTFAYAGHEEVWSDPPASPLTPSEARELDAYCAARGVELSANQNCFGHLASWLRRARYQPLAEIEGNNPWYFHQWERRGPFSLCPIEPGSEALVADLLGRLLPCFSSGLVNIGCDETFDVGWGRSRAEVDRRAGGRDGEGARERARAELYFEFVNKIAAICARHGKRPMMWADIALTQPGMLHLMPRGMIGLAWWYEPTDKFERWVSLLRENGHEAWVCPGTSSWRTFTGRTAERRANIADAAEQGSRAGATGFMVCDWGDMGHRQQWPISLAGLAQGAEAAWNPDRARAFDPRATSLHVLNDNSMTLGPWLDELGDCDLQIRRLAGVKNASALFNDLHPPVPGQLTAGEHEVGAPIEIWQAAAVRLDGLSGSRPRAADERINAELAHALECARFAADHAIAARDRGIGRSRRDALIARAEAIRATHERLWLIRNRPGGLPSASRHYDRIIEGLRKRG
jgi:hypothetical protein